MLADRLKLRKQTDSKRGKEVSFLSRSIVTISVLLLFAISAVAVVPTVYATNSYTSTTLSLGGSTLVAPLVSDWIATGAGITSSQSFVVSTGGVVGVNYQAVGSTTGTKDVVQDIFSAGFSDAPFAGTPNSGLLTVTGANDISGSDCTGFGCPNNATLAGADTLLEIPEAIAPISIMYNTPLPLTTHLNLTGAIVAQIYLGQITKWNNPHILAINPGLTSSQKTSLNINIVPVHRSDGSGTTFNLTYFFGQTDANWTTPSYACAGQTLVAGTTSASDFPTCVTELSAKGTGGVASTVSSNSGAIGYGELSYAIGAGLGYAAVLNQAGYYIVPSAATAANAISADASGIQTAISAGNGYTPTNAPGTDSYPITALTYVFFWQNQDIGQSGGGTWTRGDAFDLVQFLNFIVTQGQTDAALATFAPLPAAIQSIDLATIASVNFNGHSLTTPSTTSVTCNRTIQLVGRSVSCTVQVTGSSPTGYVSWTSSASGNFNEHGQCKISRLGKCSIVFEPTSANAAVSITATYGGDLNNAPSLGSAALNVEQRVAGMTLTCHPAMATAGSTSVTCTAVVTGFSPTGTVTFTPSTTMGTAQINGNTAVSCTLGTPTPSNARCSVTFTGTQVTGTGKVQITGAYSGDPNNTSYSKHVTVRVT